MQAMFDIVLSVLPEREGAFNDWTPFIVIGSTILGAVLSYFTFTRSRDEVIQKDARETERVNENMRHAMDMITEMQKIQSQGMKDFYAMQREIVITQQTNSSQNRRIQRLENKIDRMRNGSSDFQDVQKQKDPSERRDLDE